MGRASEQGGLGDAVADRARVAAREPRAPSTAIAAAWAQLPDKDHPVLEVLLDLPVTVVDDLDATRARAVGAFRGDQLDAHALLCAHDRGYPLITADASRYTGVRPPGIEIDQLP